MNTLKMFTAFFVSLPIIAFALNGVSASPILADVAFATYGQDKVKLCYNGDTISVDPSDVQWYLDDGATRGKCKPDSWRPKPPASMRRAASQPSHVAKNERKR